MAASTINASQNWSTKSNGRARTARRRISFNNVFRRSSTSSTATTKNSAITGGKGNTSFHSHGTDVTTNNSLASGTSSVASSSSASLALAAGSKSGGTAKISDQRTTPSARVHSDILSNNNHQTRPRRSSLKKTSSCGLEASSSLIKSTDSPPEQKPKSNKAGLASGTKRRPTFRRRSTTDVPSSSAESGRVLLSCHSSASVGRRHSVQFDNRVSFATVPTIDDLKKLGACESDLYYTDEEFASMKRAIRQDARQIKEGRMNCNETTTSTSTGTSTSTSANANTYIPPSPSQHQQNEDDLNDWGIEHHTCTKLARAARAHRVNNVIESVLREQEAQCLDLDSGLLTEASVQSLARTSSLASQAARVQAKRRASDVERHCRRWSASD